MVPGRGSAARPDSPDRVRHYDPEPPSLVLDTSLLRGQQEHCGRRGRAQQQQRTSPPGRRHGGGRGARVPRPLRLVQPLPDRGRQFVADLAGQDRTARLLFSII